jgi:hypothetical protein
MKINENVALGKSILNKVGITSDSEEYKDYLKIREICGTNTGYVGVLTRLRFIDNVDDMDEIQSIFDILKNSKMDVNKLNRLTYNQILEIFYDELDSDKEEEKDIELIYKDNNYSYYRVYTYEGILKIGSPAWCLKTKSKWDEYQKVYPEQWVVIENRYKNKLINPNNNYLDKYTNSERVWVRYGISIRNNPDNTFNWTGNNDNNGTVSSKAESWTFFGVLNTIINLMSDVKKSYYQRSKGCKQIEGTKTWHEVVNKENFFDSLKLNINDHKNILDEKSKLYVSFSESYSNIPVILVINDWYLHGFLPTSKDYRVSNTNDFFTNPLTVSGDIAKKIILDFAKDSNDEHFDGLKLANGLISMGDIEKNKKFIKKVDKWLIYDRNDNYYIIVNTDVKNEYEIPSETLLYRNYNMSDPLVWYVVKKDLKPDIEEKEFQIEVLDYLKSIKKSSDTKRVKGFWSFLKKDKG